LLSIKILEEGEVKKYLFIILIAFTTTLALPACSGGKETKKVERRTEQTKVTKKTEPRKVQSPKTSSETTNLETVRKDTAGMVMQSITAVKESQLDSVTPAKKDVQIEPDSTPLTGNTSEQAIQPSPVITDEIKTDADLLPTSNETNGVLESKVVTEKPGLCTKEAETSAKVLKILIFDDIFFDADETETPNLTFNSNYIVTLNKVVKALKTDPDIKIRLKGYAIDTGPKPGNAIIKSQKRAITVGKLILDLFPEEEKDSVANRIEIVPVVTDKMLIESDNPVKELLNHRVSIELFVDEVINPTLADFVFYGKAPEPEVTSTAPKPIQREKAKTPKSRPRTRNMLYETGNDLFKQKKYEDAISVYTEFINLDPQHPLADNAQWWIGECYYFLGDYVSALNAYRKVFGLGDGNKSAYAQLRMGYCYNRMNQVDLAVSAWEKVIRDYPNAIEEVTKAKKAIQIYSGDVNQD